MALVTVTAVNMALSFVSKSFSERRGRRGHRRKRSRRPHRSPHRQARLGHDRREGEGSGSSSFADPSPSFVRALTRSPTIARSGRYSTKQVRTRDSSERTRLLARDDDPVAGTGGSATACAGARQRARTVGWRCPHRVAVPGSGARARWRVMVTSGAGFVYARRAGPMSGNDIAVLVGFLTAAIALAGFAGIVTSIDRGAAVASNEVISFFGCGNLVTSAVASVLLSLLPGPASKRWEFFQSSLWQRCCVVSATGIGALLFSLMSARLRMSGGKDAGLSRSLFATNLTLGWRASAFGVLASPVRPDTLPGAAPTSRGSLPAVPDVHVVPSHGRHGRRRRKPRGEKEAVTKHGGEAAMASMTPRRKKVALAIAALADAVQLGFFPVFGAGGLSVPDDVLDFVVAVALVITLGWRWRLVAALALELVPGVASSLVDGICRDAACETRSGRAALRCSGGR